MCSLLSTKTNNFLNMNWLKQGFKHIWLPYTQMQTAKLPLAVKKTKGVYITLENGMRLIDGISSWWSVSHGYNHPYILKSMAKQLRTMPHVMLAGLANKPAFSLATRLSEFANQKSAKKNERLNKVFFSDSGSTAVEVAMKIAVQYFLNKGDEKKCKIMAFHNSYHGDTMGGMSLCDPKSGMHAKFKNYLPKQLTTNLPTNKAKLKKFSDFVTKNQDKAAAIIIEPLIQCAGGMKFHDAKILEDITKICKKHNILTIFDECAVGFYRTGKKFAFHHTKITPDLLIVGKALTGGTITLAATLTNDKIFNAFLDDSLDKALMHGPTFMGNALACAAANASLDLFEKFDYEKKVSVISDFLTRELEQFKNHHKVKEIRVLGAVGVIELTELTWEETLKLRENLVKHKVWLRPFANVIYFMPPLTIKNKELKKLVNAVKLSL